MLAYERDRYEDLDEYEEDDEEQEEDNGSEDGYESQQPSKEQLEYLELRQRLKEKIRKKLKKDMGTANVSSKNITGRRLDNYGSFFGPSQPVIAQRVIEESKSFLENPELLARINKPKNNTNKSFTSGSVKSKPQVNHLPAVTNGLKQKGEILKQTRDYSFLLSSDAEVPAFARNPPPKSVSDPKTDARPALLLPRGKHLANDGISDKRRESSDGRRESSHVRRESSDGRRESSHGKRESSHGRRESSHGRRESSHGRRESSHGRRESSDGRRESSDGRRESSDGRRESSDGRREFSNGRDERTPIPAGGLGKPKVMDKTAKLSIDSRKQLGSNNASGPGRPTELKSGVPSKGNVPASGKVTYTARNVVAADPKPKPSIPQSGLSKPMTSRLQSSHKFNSSSGQPSLKKPLVQRSEYYENSKPNGNVKRVLPPSKDQLKRPPPKFPARESCVDGRPKTKLKRPVHDDSDDEGAEAINMIRNMFGYNPNKFRDDDNDSDMEANYEDIMREERLSAKIARKEDEEQLRLIEEEEKRERMRAKKRKLSANG